MKKRFEHVLMTRFNLATPGYESELRNQEGWLEERFALFEKICLPSVASQTKTDFSWIIYFDVDTPSPFKARVEELKKQFPFHAYYTHLFPSSGWSRSIHEVLEPESDLVLTTRLDNDDALTSDHIERLHHAVEENKFMLGGYNFRTGYIISNRKLYRLTHPRNAFFSWLAPTAEEIKTAPAIQHMELFQHGPVFQIEGDGAWVQIVHGSNVSNKTRGWRVSPTILNEYFPVGLKKDLQEVIPAELLVENLFWAWPRNLRDKLKLTFSGQT